MVDAGFKANVYIVGSGEKVEDVATLQNSLTEELNIVNGVNAVVRDPKDLSGKKGIAADFATALIVEVGIEAATNLGPLVLGRIRSWMMKNPGKKVLLEAQLGGERVDLELSTPEQVEAVERWSKGLITASERGERVYRKYALVIGNSLYDDETLTKLKSPAADVHSLADVLGDPEIGDFDNLEILENETTQTARIKISEFFSRKSRNDLLLLYFSGHGILDEHGSLHFAFRDTTSKFLRATSLEADFLTREMDSCKSKRMVVVLDCCHSGAFAEGAKGVVGQSVGTERIFTGNGFGRMVLTSSEQTQYAWEGEKVIGKTENSLFTHYLVEGLKTGLADENGDGEISVKEWYEYAEEQVLKSTHSQTPMISVNQQQGELYIARFPVGQIPTTQPDLPPEFSETLKSPFASVRAAIISDLEGYLDSEYTSEVEQAKALLVQLSEDDSRSVSTAAEMALERFQKKNQDQPEEIQSFETSNLDRTIGDPGYVVNDAPASTALVDQQPRSEKLTTEKISSDQKLKPTSVRKPQIAKLVRIVPRWLIGAIFMGIVLGLINVGIGQLESFFDENTNEISFNHENNNSRSQESEALNEEEIETASQELPGPGGLIFFDDFSSDQGWQNQSDDMIYIDTTNEWLVWSVQRDTTRRFYIPIETTSTSLELEFSFNVQDWGGNGNVYLGLVENLSGSQDNAITATGFFMSIHKDTLGYNAINIRVTYSDQGPYTNNHNWSDSNSWLDLGRNREWLTARLFIIEDEWRLAAYDLEGILLDEISGTLPSRHESYNYFMIFRDVTSGWESMEGYLDNIRLVDAAGLSIAETDELFSEIFDTTSRTTINVSTHEITNQQYAEFLNAMGNQSEGGASWFDVNDTDAQIYYSFGHWQPVAGYDDYPVVEVTWYGAQAYCNWIGGRLPTESEWEFAARGGLEGNPNFPWGNSDPVCDLGSEIGAQYGDCEGRSLPVGSFAPNGYGLYDMAGNVWEWVEDSYGEDERVVKGGSWGNYRASLHIDVRETHPPDYSWDNGGFRCALP